MFQGIKAANFIGGLKYVNAESKISFQTLKDEDGIWNVAFMSIQ